MHRTSPRRSFERLQAGQLVEGRFRIEGEAGTGGMAEVYRARDLHAGGQVAIKVLVTGGDRDRFEREVRILAELDHPGIVRYVAHGQTPGREPFLAMEWLEGEDLGQRLDRDSAAGRGALPLGECVTLVRRVAEALGAAHARGIVHRDIKPSNLFLVGGRPEQARVLDFGIAHRNRSVRLTATGATIGTPQYMAPEQARGDGALEPPCDVFSLGCVLYECLCGRPPFVGAHALGVLAKILMEEPQPIGELRPDVPIELAVIATSMLAKDPARRPPNGDVVAARLSAIDVLAAAPTASIAPPSPRPSASLLTTGERRVVSVVVLGTGAIGDARTVESEDQTSTNESILATAREFGASAELLLDGSVVVLLTGGGTPADLACTAAACALALRSCVDGVPMAVATGRAELGTPAPLGDAIDAAVRLVRSDAEGTHAGAPTPPVRIDELTDALLDARFARELDDRGVSLVGRHDGDDVRTLFGRATPFVGGRQAELATLEGTLAGCTSESVAAAVLVTAPAGFGKSRLRYEWLRRLRARAEPAEVWLARGEPASKDSAFALVAEMTRRAAALQEGQALPLRQEKLSSFVSRHVPAEERPRVATFLGEMIGARTEEDGAPALHAARRDAQLMFEHIRAAWVDAVEAQCRARPLLLVLEDLHWADRPSVALVQSALQRCSEQPLMVLALARPDVQDRFPDLWKGCNLLQLALAPMPRRACERLVRSVLGDRSDESVVARIVEHAGGNPFFLEELIRFEVEGPRTDGQRMPETVIATVQARLELLDADSRRVLRAASIFGEVFWEQGVSALLGGGGVHRTEPSAIDVQSRVDKLVRRELVVRHPSSKFASGSEVAFRHMYVREAAYAMLTDQDRSVGHRLAAAWLEETGEDSAAVLAGHLEQSGDPTRAAVFYARAAEQVLEGNDFDSVLRFADRGVRCGADGETLGRLFRMQAEAHRWRGRNAEAAQCAERAARLLSPASEPWGEAMLQLASTLAKADRIDDLTAIGEQLCALISRREGGAACVRAAAVAAGELGYAGRHELADRLVRAAVEATTESIDPLTRARVLRVRGLRALHRGDKGEFLARLSEAASAFALAGDLRSALLAHIHVGYAATLLGDFSEGERILRDALRTAERLGLDVLAAATKHNLGWAVARQGRLAEACSIEADAVADFARHRDARMEGLSRQYLAVMWLQSGSADRAEAEARSAIDCLAATPSGRCVGLAVLSEILRARGDTRGALVAAQDAIAILEEIGCLEEGEPRVRLALALALDAAGDRVAARRAVDAARDRLLESAERIADARLRASFLGAIPEHARIVSLAEAWSQPGPAERST